MASAAITGECHKATVLDWRVKASRQPSGDHLGLGIECRVGREPHDVAAARVHRVNVRIAIAIGREGDPVGSCRSPRPEGSGAPHGGDLDGDASRLAADGVARQPTTASANSVDTGARGLTDRDRSRPRRLTSSVGFHQSR